jgi:hypothetical protein
MEKQVVLTFVHILRENKIVATINNVVPHTFNIMIQNITTEHAKRMCYDYGYAFWITSNTHVQSILVE